MEAAPCAESFLLPPGLLTELQTHGPCPFDYVFFSLYRLNPEVNGTGDTALGTLSHNALQEEHLHLYEWKGWGIERIEKYRGTVYMSSIRP